MQKQLGSSLSLKKLFYTKKGKKILFLFLSKTKIVIKKWLMAARTLKKGQFLINKL